MKFAFIYSHREEHTVMKMCSVLGVSKSGYYEYVKRVSREETEREKWNRRLDERILFHYHDNIGAYGSPRIFKKLVKDDGIQVSAKKVANRMRDLNLYANPQVRYIQTTNSNHDKRVFSNELDRNFQPEAPNQVWATDITYVHTGEGFVYFNPILDLYGKKVISYAIKDRIDKSLPLEALKKALAIREPEEGWIHHSDRGSQYCSTVYIETLKQAKARISMSRKATPYDNACVESFFASLKKEYLHKWVFKTKAEAMNAIEFYVEFYNKKRIHSTLGYVTPIEYELAHELAQQQNATMKNNTCA